MNVIAELDKLSPPCTEIAISCYVDMDGSKRWNVRINIRNGPTLGYDAAQDLEYVLTKLVTKAKKQGWSW